MCACVCGGGGGGGGGGGLLKQALFLTVPVYCLNVKLCFVVQITYYPTCS